MLSAKMNRMRTGSRSDDDQLVRRLLAPPDLEDGVQSLGYWWGRSRHLPWYRLRARLRFALVVLEHGFCVLERAATRVTLNESVEIEETEQPWLRPAAAGARVPRFGRPSQQSR